MKYKFDELSHQVSKATTQKYSTSFSMGILALSPKIRCGIYAIYGYVRLADEIVDSFQGYDKKKLLQRLKEQTWEALNDKISLNPILQAFQETVHKYNIDQNLIVLFLQSMEMDLHKLDYNSEQYNQYILGSAEVVGLMCLQIFVNGDHKTFTALKPYAMKLGSAFQKVNFLRDLKDDFQVLGRSYFPDVNLNVFDNAIKQAIEMEIDAEFKEALTGIRKLPPSSKFGVHLAYTYYLSLFRKIKTIPAQKIMKQRIRISNGRKLSLVMLCYMQNKMALV